MILIFIRDWQRLYWMILQHGNAKQDEEVDLFGFNDDNRHMDYVPEECIGYRERIGHRANLNF